MYECYECGVDRGDSGMREDGNCIDCGPVTKKKLKHRVEELIEAHDRLAAENAELLERCGLRGHELTRETERADSAELLLRTANAENAELRRINMESNDLIVRLGNENAELRNVLAKYAHAVGEGHPIPCDLGPLCPYCYIDRIDADLAVANATLDALREAVPEDTWWCRDCKKFTKPATDPDGEYCSECKCDGYWDDEFPAFVYNTLHPQPKETTDDER